MIFFYTPTTCSLAANIALEETGAAFEPRLVKLWKPEEVEAYRQINPGRTIPALKVGEVIFTETPAILYYLAQSYPKAGLMPADLLDQALCLSKVSWLSSSVHIARRQYRAPFRFAADKDAQGHVAEAGKAEFSQFMQRIDALYEGRTWMVADQFTIADCYAMLFYDWGSRDEHDMASLAHFTAFKDRMMTRPGVLRALELHKSPLLTQAAA